MVLFWPSHLADYDPRDIPNGIDAYVNVVSVTTHQSCLRFHVRQLYTSQQSLINATRELIG
jgi:hypothetical protein